ncbi:hypothetical protein [Virgibacillus chiguensis]|uniref:hypothetical protein n=1 Tax=Virgibacillus chiguensis TaxID=411959 RepID=UPI00093268F3|nr:hypothetical protein [Virgibacillus chiguensis]
MLAIIIFQPFFVSIISILTACVGTYKQLKEILKTLSKTSAKSGELCVLFPHHVFLSSLIKIHDNVQECKQSKFKGYKSVHEQNFYK